MLEVFALLFFVSVLGTVCEKCKIKNKDNKLIWSKTSNLFFVIICIILILFAGLRTKSNDTELYILNYIYLDNDFATFDWHIGSNPFFVLYQMILKSFGINELWFIFITSFFVELSYLLFLKKYSINFGVTVFIFISFGIFGMTMAAMKQTISIAIGIWAIPLFVNNKKIISILIILFGMMFHPHIICYVIMFFLSDNIWNKKHLLIILIFIIISFYFTSFFNEIQKINYQLTGDNYNISQWTENQVNPYRLIFYLICPVLSYIYRNKIREKNNKLLFIFINFSFLSSCFCFLSLFGGAFTVGRMISYFNYFNSICIPVCLSLEQNINKRNNLLLVVIFLLLIFYFFLYRKFGVFPLLNCYFTHTNILKLFGI